MREGRLDKSAAAAAVAEIRRKRAERHAAARARTPAPKPLPPKTMTAGGTEVRHTRERGHGITYERKRILCGKKGCNKLHGPYWYAFWSARGKVRSVYIGKTFRKVEEKCPERLKTPVDDC
jgi:hypothetical protein